MSVEGDIFKEKKYKFSRRSNSSVYDNQYLLKANQVPVNEFLKLRINYDEQLEIQKADRKNKLISKKRYKDLTAQYTCTNRDPRLVIQNQKANIAAQIGNTSFKMVKSQIVGNQYSSSQISQASKERNVRFQNGSAVSDVLSQLNSELQKYTYTGQGYTPRKKVNRKKSLKFQESMIPENVLNNKPGSNQALERHEVKRLGSGQSLIFKSEIKSYNDDIISELNDRENHPMTMKNLPRMSFSPKNQGQSQEEQNSSFFKQRVNSPSQKNTVKIIDQSDFNSPNKSQQSSPLNNARQTPIIPQKQLVSSSQVAEEFLSSGLGKKYKKLQYYNSLKYSKNSPRGKEVRILSANPDILQRQGQNFIIQQRKMKMEANRLRLFSPHEYALGPFSDEYVLSNQHSQESNMFSNNSALKKMRASQDKSKLYSPTQGENGQFQCFKQFDYDNWFMKKIRRMKDVSLLKYQCQDYKNKNYNEMKSFCHSRRGSNSMMNNSQAGNSSNRQIQSMASSPIKQLKGI
ncbi:UNKNOWN [Stylonychia lemnae]|uniref:Uncharacterized protein n=1 Tax=Stylonychia lemnae TaxID=5949 RepID=A0A078AUE9_STYLE|nr:UNKNOWN [Stylonychia lemnae]|eukprot:CDW86020.1 UNKNOWN [Stylonychia lemnae]